MAKVVHVTLMLELIDDQANPEHLDWFSILENMPEITGFSFIDSEIRPFPSMEDDPSNHTQH